MLITLILIVVGMGYTCGISINSINLKSSLKLEDPHPQLIKYREARSLINQGDYFHAKSLFEELHQENINNPQANNVSPQVILGGLINIALHDQDYYQAQEYLNQLEEEYQPQDSQSIAQIFLQIKVFDYQIQIAQGLGDDDQVLDLLFDNNKLNHYDLHTTLNRRYGQDIVASELENAINNPIVVSYVDSNDVEHHQVFLRIFRWEVELSQPRGRNQEKGFHLESYVEGFKQRGLYCHYHSCSY